MDSLVVFRAKVHSAAAIIEVCLKNGIILKTGEGLVCPVDENGNFTDKVTKACGLRSDQRGVVPL